MVETAEKVEEFLSKVKEILNDETRWCINEAPWSNKVNKTRKYMTETGVTANDIRDIIKELTVENYSATKPDENINFPGEQVWEFGINKIMVDVSEDFYVKLKIRDLGDECLLIMSFHPEAPNRPEKKLQFPYSKS